MTINVSICQSRSKIARTVFVEVPGPTSGRRQLSSNFRTVSNGRHQAQSRRGVSATLNDGLQPATALPAMAQMRRVAVPSAFSHVAFRRLSWRRSRSGPSVKPRKWRAMRLPKLTQSPSTQPGLPWRKSTAF